MTDRNGNKIEVGDRVEVAPDTGQVHSLTAIVTYFNSMNTAIVEQIGCAAVYVCLPHELTKVKKGTGDAIR